MSTIEPQPSPEAWSTAPGEAPMAMPELAPPVEPLPAVPMPAPRRPAPPWAPGFAALALAVVAVAVEIVAISIGSSGEWKLSTFIAYVSILVSVVAVVLGIVAVVRTRGTGRRYAIAAIVLGVLGNPFVQVWVLRLGGTS